MNISFINTTVDYIDYGTEKEPNLVFKDGFFYNTEDRNPFKQKQVTVVAALAETIFYQDIKIRLNPDMMYQDDSNPIKNLTAIINGTEIKLVSNFENLKEATDYKLKGDEKEILFNIEFKNETKIQTRASLSISLPQVSTAPSSTFPLEENFNDNLGIDRNSLENTIPFKGYNETTPIFGVLDYRTYYNTITNNGSLKSKINKPVIILDGFDPGDKRKIYPESSGYSQDSKSLYELMTYDHDNNPNTQTKNFVDDILRPQGFDVTLVNFPENKIVHPTQPTRDVWIVTNVITHQIHMPWPFQSMTITTYEEVGHWTTVTNYQILADGGADYIERNAMALVALLKRENQKLVANGSSENITLIGPSMGGLISRYALAYMEKNNIPHNVKLWVSFDSPHLGANIPIAAQENIYFFGHFGQKEQAKHKFHENFANPAARQMLIEQMDYKHQNYEPNDNPKLWATPNGSFFNFDSGNPTFLGQNNNSPFRTRFMNELENLNGLPNSKGFPTNVRKIALINGTTNGMKTHSENELFLELAGFKYGFFKAVIIEDRNLSTSGNWAQTFSGRVTIPASPSVLEVLVLGISAYIPTIIDKTVNRPNLNPRGSMDVVQGGMFDTQTIIKNEFSPQLDEAGVEQQWRTYKPYHAFIPTVSSLAFKNPNFDWSTPLNRNLVCDPANKEIVFDSYFSPSKNEEHVALTKESVDWLLAEIQGNQQPASFSINDSQLAGLRVICNNQIASYSFGTDVCKLPAAVQSWSVSPNLQINSSNGLNITVQANITGDGEEGIITAHFSSAVKFEIHIWIGKPAFTFQYDYFDPQPVKSTLSIVSADPNVDITKQGITSVVFRGRKNSNGLYYNMTKYGLYSTRPSGYSNITATVTNACGSTVILYDDFNRISNNNNVTTANIYKVFPNPAKDIVSIETNDIDFQPEENTTITGELFDVMGIPTTKVEIKDNKATFSVVGLRKGIYVLKIYIDNQTETHQIAVE